MKVAGEMRPEGVLPSPQEVVRRAKEVGLSCIAITDHNTLEGISEASEAGNKYGVIVIPGIEISSVEGKRTPHVLGLGIDHKTKDVPHYRSAGEVMSWVKERGGFVFIPHPTEAPSAFSFGVEEVKKLRPLIDGLEVCNWWRGLDHRMVELANSQGLVMIGGSDSHILNTIGLVESPYENGDLLKSIPKDILPKRTGKKMPYIKAIPNLISFGARLFVNTRANPFIG